MHTESHYILHGVRAGAKGVVLKTHASEDLVRAIREASRGGTYMSSQVSSALVQAYQGKTELRPDPLSPRERQVQLIAEGKTTKEVATFLQISVKTSETHRTRIMTKLNRRGKPSKSGRNLTIFSKYLRAGTPTRRHALGRLPTPPPLPENLLLGLHRKLPSAPLRAPRRFRNPKIGQQLGAQPTPRFRVMIESKTKATIDVDIDALLDPLPP